MPDPVQPRLYKLLGVAQDASQPDITQAYRRRARELHPDLAETDGGNEAFTALTRAYRLLSDPTQRAAYDATLRNARSSTTPHAIPVPIRHVANGFPRPPQHPMTAYDRRQPPIIAGPTRVYPNDPEAIR